MEKSLLLYNPIMESKTNLSQFDLSNSRYEKRVWISRGMSLTVLVYFIFLMRGTTIEAITLYLGATGIVMAITLIRSHIQNNLKKKDLNLWRKKYPSAARYDDEMRAKGNDFRAIFMAMFGSLYYKSQVSGVKKAEYVGPQASFSRRFVAMIVDFVLCVGLLVVLIMLSTLGISSAEESVNLIVGILTIVTIFLVLVVPPFFIYKFSATPGKKIMGIKVVDVDGSKLTWKQAFIREVFGKGLSGLVWNLGYLWAIWDKNQQTWHDKMAHTIVVKSR